MIRQTSMLPNGLRAYFCLGNQVFIAVAPQKASEHSKEGGLSLDLLNVIQSFLTPDLINRTASLANETPEKISDAMSAIVPALLAGVVDNGSTPPGANKLMHLIKAGGFQEKLAVFRLDGSGSSLSGLMAAGETVVCRLLGTKLVPLTENITRSSGIRQGSVTSLIWLAVPLVLGVLGREAQSRGLGGSALTAVLLSERESIAKQLPAALGELFPSAKPPVTNTVPPPAAFRVEYPATAKWNHVAMWIVPLLVVTGLVGLYNWLRAPDQTRARRASITLPGGAVVHAAETSVNYALANFLAGSGNSNIPKRFVFDNLNFPAGSIELNDDSLRTISDLAAILRAYPNTQVRLEGYTDNTGNNGANKELSLQRVLSIKELLAQSKVDATRIETVGLGSENPAASNDTEEGRRRNRRMELLVVQK